MLYSTMLSATCKTHSYGITGHNKNAESCALYATCIIEQEDRGNMHIGLPGRYMQKVMNCVQKRRCDNDDKLFTYMLL